MLTSRVTKDPIVNGRSPYDAYGHIFSRQGQGDKIRTRDIYRAVTAQAILLGECWREYNLRVHQHLKDPLRRTVFPPTPALGPAEAGSGRTWDLGKEGFLLEIKEPGSNGARRVPASEHDDSPASPQRLRLSQFPLFKLPGEERHRGVQTKLSLLHGGRT